MVKFAVAKQMAGKRLITNDGEELGKLVDVVVNEVSGKMEEVLIDPNPDNATAKRLKHYEDKCSIPYSAVLAIADHIIIDKKGI